MSSKRKQVSVSEDTSEKLETLRAKFWLEKKQKHSSDDLIAFLVTKELSEMDKTENQKEK